MSAYAVAHLRSVTLGPDIVEYLQGIDATLVPYEGRFLVHGDPADVREGDFNGDLIVIEFPDRDHAVGWYESRAYRDIVDLRTKNSTGWVVLIDGVPPDHRATDILDASRVGKYSPSQAQKRPVPPSRFATGSVSARVAPVGSDQNVTYAVSERGSVVG